MRVLVTSSAMAGHFGPLRPFIEALRDRGDDVLLVVPEAARDHARATGVPLLEGGSPDPGELEELWRAFRAADRREASVIANREIFGRLNTAAMLPSVEEAVDVHRPDLVLHEVTEYAGPIVAMRAAIPHVQVAISMAEAEDGSLSIAAPALERYGPVVAVLRAAPYLTRFPAVIDPSPYPDTRRYREPPTVPLPLPDWWSGSTDPLVYVTFGTVSASIGSGPYRAATEALADLDVRVLMTTGQPIDLGGLPGNVHVTDWVDQAAVLATAGVVVCHGGSGTVLGALATGVPMVIRPMFADQFLNARAIQALGAGVVVEPEGDTAAERAAYHPGAVAALRSGVGSALTDESIRAAARRAATELAARPDPADLLAALLN